LLEKPGVEIPVRLSLLTWKSIFMHCNKTLNAINFNYRDDRALYLLTFSKDHISPDLMYEVSRFLNTLESTAWALKGH
jgi:hypothetical protein